MSETLVEEKLKDVEFDYHVDQFLEMMVDNEASDMIVKAGSPPAFRIDGKIHKARMNELTPEHVIKLAGDFMDNDDLSDVLEGGEYDGSYAIDGTGRFRVNVFLQRGTVSMVFRHIESEILGFSELNLPPSMEKIPQFDRGLVLVTGTTSSGKSTTLASIIDYINRNMSKHVITIEDPIEFIHSDQRSIISQREVGTDTQDYTSALKYVLRQDPDIILLGEMRDQETVEAALEAAETGHLVFSTLHTNSTPQTLDRILEFFPENESDQIQALLAEYLMAVCGQRLLARKDEQGMIPAVELMFNNPTIKKLILENRLDSLRSAIHQGENEGMQTFDQSIVELFNGGKISEDEARSHCSNPANFEMYVKGHFPDVQSGVLGG